MRSRFKIKRRTRVAFLALATALVVAVPVAWASHDFTDVPTSHPFHSAISAMKGAGITSGCTATQYCPDAAVTRGQMAVFLNRAAGRAGRTQTFATATTTESNLATVSLTVPGPGFVLVNSSTDISCSCRLITRLRNPATGAASWYVGEAVTGSDSGNTSNTYLFHVPAAGAHTIELRGSTNTGTASVWSDVTALWVPFGSTGGNTFGTSAGAASGAGVGGANGR